MAFVMVEMTLQESGSRREEFDLERETSVRLTDPGAVPMDLHLALYIIERT